MTTYKLTGEGYVIKDGTTKVPTADTAQFPNTNPDFLAYKTWLLAGGVPDPAEPPPMVVPSAVTMRQARLALRRAGLIDSVDPAIAAIADPGTRRDAQIEWEFSNELQRANPFVATLGSALGLTSAQVDALFVQAAGL